jgi:hypothetical protein
MQAVIGRLRTVQYRSQFRHVTLLATITFYAGDHADQHAWSLQAVVGRVHTVQYRSHFRHVFLLASLTFYAGAHAEWQDRKSVV